MIGFMQRGFWLALVAGALMFFAVIARAEQAQTFGNIEVHYNAFNSTFLDPETAAQYELTRSKQYGVINVAVLDAGKAGKPALAAMVKGSFQNLIGQIQDLDFRQVKEGDAIYYITSFRFSEDEVLRFTINVQTDPNQPAHKIEFSQRFYTE